MNKQGNAMYRNPSKSGRSSDQKKGAAHVLITGMLFAFLIVAAMSVDYAYMQLVRTELRTATDAAAKAGTEALVRFQDGNQAKAAAVAYAAKNKVGGQPFAISTSDVKLGKVTGQTNGSWTFVENATPFNACRVNAKVGNGGVTSAIPTFFGSALGRSTFSTSQQATAGEQEVEICLCLDRSGSMMFDMTGTDWSYPSGNTLLYPSGYYDNWTDRNYSSPPHPTNSRWAVAMSSVNTFLNTVGAFNFPPRTAVVTWSSASTLSDYPYYSYTIDDVNVALPAYSGFSWSANRTSINNALSTLTSRPIVGGTNCSAGIDEAVSVLTGTNSRALSKKIIILLTDGQWNQGRDPQLAAQDAATAGVTIHCISMITSTQATLTQVASTTGGSYYTTSNATQLQQAFTDIAKNLPIVLTD